MRAPFRLRSLVAVVSLLLPGRVDAAGGAYDPLAVAGDRPKILDLVVVDGSREREIPLRVYLPRDGSPAPVVLFSHGLGGSREGNATLGTHWALRGYVAVFLQHPGSDSSVWRDVPPRQRRGAMEQAAGAQNFLLRVKDVKAVLDQLARWNEGGQSLPRGAAGPAPGRHVRPLVRGSHDAGGERPAGSGAACRSPTPRIRAAIAMSPSRPRRGGDAAEAFGGVGIPWLLMTGTKDLAPIGGADLESRLAVFPALPPGGKYELVLDGAEHSAFTDRALPGDTEPRNPNHHRVILALSTAFWDAWLRGDPDARRWLDGNGPRAVLESGDRWQRK